MSNTTSDSELQQKWLKHWEEGKTPGHKSEIDVNVKKYLKELTQENPSASILLPWCGKSLDMQFLCSQGYSVVGIELSQRAVRQVFDENNIPYSVTEVGEFAVYQAKDKKLKIIQGDYYKITPELAGTFDAVWDNNAFGSAQVENRHRYISVLAPLLKPNGQVLLANWEYGELVRDTYPFSLSSSRVKDLFQEKFEVRYLGKCKFFTDYLIKLFGCDWAHRNIHLLQLKLDCKPQPL